MRVDSTWFRCPNCFLDLGPVSERTHGCASGHRFDESKHGFLTLLPPKAPRTMGDDRAMLEARAAFLDTGAFDPIAASLADLAAEAPAITAGDPDSRLSPSIADLGCGTGWYAARVVESLSSLSAAGGGGESQARVLLADRSPDAVRVARRTVAAADDAGSRSRGMVGDDIIGVTGVIVDLWRPLPVRDGVAELLLNVFAPRNPPEFGRILAPGGRLLVVVPTRRHLLELRRDGRMLDVPEGKAAAVIDSFAPTGLVAVEQRRVDYAISVDAAQRTHLVAMGPSARHSSRSVDVPGGPDDDALIETTVSVDVLAFERI